MKHQSLLGYKLTKFYYTNSVYILNINTNYMYS